MLAPTVNYLGPAHPQRDSVFYVVLPGQHADPELERETADAPRQQSRRTLPNVKLITLLTTIAMFALPAADALARCCGHV
jgi:hypothetical protein